MLHKKTYVEKRRKVSQKENDPNMLQRMAEYHGLFFRTYNLPIRHVVVYLGKRKASMKSSLDDDKIFKEFDLISIYDIDKDEFISAQTPPVIMLELLTNFRIINRKNYKQYANNE